MNNLNLGNFEGISLPHKESSFFSNHTSARIKADLNKSREAS